MPQETNKRVLKIRACQLKKCSGRGSCGGRSMFAPF
jgi:hypothetical protein